MTGELDQTGSVDQLSVDLRSEEGGEDEGQEGGGGAKQHSGGKYWSLLTS